MKKSLQIFTLILTGTLVLSGCASVKNFVAKRGGSLDYQKSQKLNPIQLPAQQAARNFVPLYDVPPSAQVFGFSNESGTQYQLPKPPKVR